MTRTGIASAHNSQLTFIKTTVQVWVRKSGKTSFWVRKPGKNAFGLGNPIKKDFLGSETGKNIVKYSRFFIILSNNYL